MSFKRIGRPTIGDRAMTPAQSKARQRAKLKSEGFRIFEIKVSAKYAALVMVIAKIQGVTEKALIEQMIPAALDAQFEILRKESVERLISDCEKSLGHRLPDDFATYVIEALMLGQPLFWETRSDKN